MIICYPENTTRVMNAPADWDNTTIPVEGLPIVDAKLEDGTNVMMSVWLPTPDELEMLNNGGRVVLSILGEQHPIVSVEVQ